MKKPPQEEMSVNLDAFMRPKPMEHIILSNPRSTMQVCRIIVGSNAVPAGEGKEGKAITTSGTAVDDQTLRVIRREAMERQIEVLAGEVSARLTVEPMPSIATGSVVAGGTQEGLARYKALSPAERLILLAEQTGAQAMLVLDEAGVWFDTRIVEFDEKGVPVLRDKRGTDDNAAGCQNPLHPSFAVPSIYVGLRAKLVSLKRKEHGAILADIEVFEPLSDKIDDKQIPKWAFQPRTADRCRDYESGGVSEYGFRGWQCVKETETVGYDRAPAWCEPLGRAIARTTDEIKAIHWQDRYAGLVKKMMDRLFPVVGRKCGDEPAPVAPPVDDKKVPPLKGIKGKVGGR